MLSAIIQIIAMLHNKLTKTLKNAATMNQVSV